MQTASKYFAKFFCKIQVKKTYSNITLRITYNISKITTVKHLASNKWLFRNWILNLELLLHLVNSQTCFCRNTIPLFSRAKMEICQTVMQDNEAVSQRVRDHMKSHALQKD